MRRLVLIIFWPKQAALELKARPRWILAFLILAIVGMAVEAYTYDRSVLVMLNHLPPSAGPPEKRELLERLSSGAAARTAFVPARLVLGWALFAFLLAGAARAVAEQERVAFRGVFPLVVHAGAIEMLGKVAGATGLFQFGAPSQVPGGSARLSSALSLASVIRPADFTLFSLLDAVSLFSVWYVLVLACGLSVLSGFRFGKSLGLSVALWAFSDLANAGILALLRENMHLMP